VNWLRFPVADGDGARRGRTGAAEGGEVGAGGAAADAASAVGGASGATAAAGSVVVGRDIAQSISAAATMTTAAGAIDATWARRRLRERASRRRLVSTSMALANRSSGRTARQRAITSRNGCGIPASLERGRRRWSW
jgi:hypothetical protein